MTRRDLFGAGALLLAGAASSFRSAARGSRTTTAVTLTTLDGGTVVVRGAAIDTLRQRLRGNVLIDGMEGYDAARSIWNAAIDRRPALVVRCVDVHDIVQAVRFAETHDALVSVRGGGHNAAGFAVCQGGVLIDLTRLRTVDVDPLARTATAGGGATFAEYDAATHAFGLASTGPVVSMVGVGGYTLGGGVGWLHRKLGLACDTLIAAQVVTADGRILETSSAEHDDLFWALRGGGGNFGVVSAFRFRLAPVSTVLAGLIVHPLEDLPEVAACVRDFNATAPDDVCVWLMLRKAAASPQLPTEIHGRPVAIIGVCHAGPKAAGDTILRPLRRFGRPLADLVTFRAYADWQRSLDGAWGNGFGNQWLGHYLPALTDAAARTLLEHVTNVTSPFTDVKLVHLGGAVARVGEHETAFSHRTSAYALAIQTRWPLQDEAARHFAWSQACFEAMAAHSTVKASYDPRNRFRMNQNIRPAIAPQPARPTV